jgi:hypothetical protein
LASQPAAFPARRVATVHDQSVDDDRDGLSRRDTEKTVMTKDET